MSKTFQYKFLKYNFILKFFLYEHFKMSLMNDKCLVQNYFWVEQKS